MRKLECLALVVALLTACGDSDGPRAAAQPDGSAGGASEPSDDAGMSQPEIVTYWHDMVPLFEHHCLQCHQQGGIGPLRLDSYAEAKQNAALIGLATKARDMPPWDATSDGTCGEFQQSLALDDTQIALIDAWVKGGAREGTTGQVQVPAPDHLPHPSEWAMPSYTPKIQGGELAANDDYHCFLMDANVAGQQFITGYEIVPGVSEVVHHVVVSVVDPDAAADPMLPDGTTNRQAMAALDAESPDQPGWPCFGLAGDGVQVRSVPVVWAPGQGVVGFPGASGVPLRASDKLVVQVHYNLADAKQRGKTDNTRLRFELAERVENIAVFAIPDALLESLFGPEPDLLPAGQKSVLYSFKRRVAELGLGERLGGLDDSKLPPLSLWGVMPHMHERGRKYQMRVKAAEADAMQCAVDVQSWDFHWQRMYFYEKPWRMTSDSEIEVTCDFDTSRAQAPVSPGWGTGNEMCLATLFFTVPASAVGF